jgi:hypothetical protein
MRILEKKEEQCEKDQNPNGHFAIYRDRKLSCERTLGIASSRVKYVFENEENGPNKKC